MSCNQWPVSPLREKPFHPPEPWPQPSGSVWILTLPPPAPGTLAAFVLISQGPRQPRAFATRHHSVSTRGLPPPPPPARNKHAIYFTPVPPLYLFLEFINTGHLFAYHLPPLSPAGSFHPLPSRVACHSIVLQRGLAVMKWPELCPLCWLTDTGPVPWAAAEPGEIGPHPSPPPGSGACAVGRNSLQLWCLCKPSSSSQAV